jgi:hypothetical protein
MQNVVIHRSVHSTAGLETAGLAFAASSSLSSSAGVWWFGRREFACSFACIEAGGRSEPRQERARPCRMWSFTAAYTRRLGLRLLRRRTSLSLSPPRSSPPSFRFEQRDSGPNHCDATETSRIEGRSEPRQERARPCRMWSFTAAYTRRLGLRLLRAFAASSSLSSSAGVWWFGRREFACSFACIEAGRCVRHLPASIHANEQANSRRPNHHTPADDDNDEDASSPAVECTLR